jgi:Clp amino terminal domain, pathogenicity island component
VIRRSSRVHRVLDLARDEAERFGHRYVGPEHLVLGVLRDGTGGAAWVLRARGVDLAAARAALGRLVELEVVPGPRPSDAELLGMLGIDLDAVRQSAERAFGPQAIGRAIGEATRARRGGVGRVPRTPLRGPPVFWLQASYHAGEQAKALGQEVVGPELLLLGVVVDAQTPWPRCMFNRWNRRLRASVDLPNGYQGAAGPLLAALGVDLEELRTALLAELNAAVG